MSKILWDSAFAFPPNFQYIPSYPSPHSTNESVPPRFSATLLVTKVPGADDFGVFNIGPAIPSFSVLGEYVGEIVAAGASGGGEANNYIFEIPGDRCLNAQEKGNWVRWINSVTPTSSNANLFVMTKAEMIVAFSIPAPRLAAVGAHEVFVISSSEGIAPGEQLRYKYGQKYSGIHDDALACVSVTVPWVGDSTELERK